jgi:NADPH-dependent ferric siderophore reductase
MSVWHVSDAWFLCYPGRLRAGVAHFRVVVVEEASRPMKRAHTLRNVAKGAGTVVLALIAIDLIATVITIAVGAELLKR